MGEAFGDLNAMEYVNEYHYVPVSGNKFVEGAYVTGNPSPASGLRDELADERRLPEPGPNPHVNSLNLGDYEFDFDGQEVHADGEIWIASNYTLRQLFLNRYPAHGTAVDISVRDRAACPSTSALVTGAGCQLYFDAMLLMPTGPTLIDARDAMLAADQTRFGGANQDLIWRGFAERGFGPVRVDDRAERQQPGPGLLVAARDRTDRDVQGGLEGHGRPRSRSTRRSTSATTRPA